MAIAMRYGTPGESSGGAGGSSGGSCDLLWTNPDTSVNFAAQDVALDLSGYQMVAVFFLESKTATSGVWTLAIVNAGTTNRAVIIYNARQLRNFTVSSSGVSFAVGQYATQTGSITTNNGYAIPLYIYGIKF